MRQLLFSRPLMLALGLWVALAATSPLHAQNQSRSGAAQGQAITRPALDLKARDIRTDRAAVSEKSLMIASLDVTVQIDGGLAETTITARFTNPSDAILEGDFTIDLPREAWVTGFALDVNGILVDGVLQPKAKATEAYEENLRRGVDPGLGEINAANQFRTRIFPINPRSGRIIKISYVSTLDAAGRYILPLTTAGPVGDVKISVLSEGQGRSSISVPRGLSTVTNDQALAYFQGQNIALAGDLKATNFGPQDDVTVTTSRNGDAYFSFLVPAAPISATKPKIVRLYWDASRSRRDDDLAKEIVLLERYVAQVQPERLDLILFADNAPQTLSLTRATMGTLGAQLRGVHYQGASRFGELEAAGQGEADVCLMFSDGQLTVDAFKVSSWPCRVITVSTSPNVRRDILEGIADTNRGAFIDLKAASITDALTALQARGPDLRALVTGAGIAVDYSVLPTAAGLFRISGPRPEADDLVVKGYGIDRRLSLREAISVNHNGAATVWGASQIKRLSATDNPDSEALLAAVRRYGVATTDFSYIVLETVEDYARNNIAPAPSIGKEFLASYQARRTEIEAAERAAKDARFQSILALWNEQKTWWKTRFDPQAKVKDPDNNSNNPQEALVDGQSPAAMNRPPQPEPSSPPSLSPRPPVQRATAPLERDSVATTGAQVQEARATAPPQVRPNGAPSTTQSTSTSLPQSTMSISTATWNPNRPYLSALREVKSGDDAAFETIYRAQEVRFGDTPAFYFDMAEWAYRNGLQSRAAALARNALELSNTTIDTKIILASRLVRYGDYDRAIWLNERILQATPTKPQALRNLALSIVDATDARRTASTLQSPATIAAYQRALALLMRIVLTPNNGDYDGIEVIALMEANHIVATLKSLGVTEAALSPQIDPRLISLLAVDIRVTLEWNTDKTDMDLWVDEPSGERAIYSNPRTAIGGRLSNDMTRGYGPEEYLLTNAPNGLYKVLSNAYAADRLDPNGPTSLTVRLYRDWGRPTEKVESFVVELNRGQQNATTEIGRFIRGPVTPSRRPN